MVGALEERLGGAQVWKEDNFFFLNLAEEYVCLKHVQQVYFGEEVVSIEWGEEECQVAVTWRPHPSPAPGDH